MELQQKRQKIKQTHICCRDLITLQNSLDNKVDKILGKELSTNDFTNEEKNKLVNIQTEATKNQTDAHLLNKNNHTGIQSISTITNLQTTLDNKVDKVTGKELSTNDFTNVLKTKLDGIATQATKNQTDTHLLARSNHTGSQAISTITNLQTSLNNKVDKVTGKQLSTNDFTNALKTKLENIDDTPSSGGGANLPLGSLITIFNPRLDTRINGTLFANFNASYNTRWNGNITSWPFRLEFDFVQSIPEVLPASWNPATRLITINNTVPIAINLDVNFSVFTSRLNSPTEIIVYITINDFIYSPISIPIFSNNENDFFFVGSPLERIWLGRGPNTIGLHVNTFDPWGWNANARNDEVEFLSQVFATIVNDNCGAGQTPSRGQRVLKNGHYTNLWNFIGAQFDPQPQQTSFSLPNYDFPSLTTQTSNANQNTKSYLYAIGDQ